MFLQNCLYCKMYPGCLHHAGTVFVLDKIRRRTTTTTFIILYTDMKRRAKRLHACARIFRLRLRLI